MSTPSDEGAIRNLAYQLWEQRGRPEGRAEEHWYEAEKRLQSTAVDEAAQDSFPASDAPASHLPDEPPANAEDKWQAAAEHPERPVAPVRNPVHEVNPRLDGAHAKVPTPKGRQPAKVGSGDARGG